MNYINNQKFINEFIIWSNFFLEPQKKIEENKEKLNSCLILIIQHIWLVILE